MHVHMYVCMYVCKRERERENESLLFTMTRRWLVVKLALSFSTTCIRFWIVIFSFQCLGSRWVYPHKKEYRFHMQNEAWVSNEGEREKERDWMRKVGKITDLNWITLDHVARESVWSVVYEMMCMLLFPRMWMSVAVDWIIKVNILMAQMI